MTTTSKVASITSPTSNEQRENELKEKFIAKYNVEGMINLSKAEISDTKPCTKRYKISSTTLLVCFINIHCIVRIK